MTAYDIALFIHLMGLVAMFGGFAVYTRAGNRLRAATDMDQVRSWLGLLESSSPMFASGSLLLLLSGLYMTFSRWRTPQPWILVAMVGLLTIWILGATVSGRHLREIRAAVAGGRESISGELSHRIARPAPWTVVTSLNGLAVGIMFVMTTKPGWAVSIGTALLATAIGMVVGTSYGAAGSLGFAASGERSPIVTQPLRSGPFGISSASLYLSIPTPADRRVPGGYSARGDEFFDSLRSHITYAIGPLRQDRIAPNTTDQRRR